MVLCEDESCGLVRVTSDDRIVRGIGQSGKRLRYVRPRLLKYHTPKPTRRVAATPPTKAKNVRLANGDDDSVPVALAALVP